MKAITGVAADEVKGKEEYVLYVEGNEQSIDVDVLRTFLGNVIGVRPMGSSSTIRGAADALRKTHPKDYFLIDRDYRCSDEFIDEHWNRFSDPDSSNLLIWRRKEFENYFLEPSFLIQSQFCKQPFQDNNGQKLKELVMSLANKRLYLEAANYVIVSLQVEIKGDWINTFSEPSDFPDKKSALERLTHEFDDYSKKISHRTAKQKVTECFQDVLTQMTGGNELLQWDSGEWLNMISGKSIFHALVGQCFQVKNQAGTILQGKDAINLVAKDLLRTGTNLPSDFTKLKELINARIRKI